MDSFLTSGESLTIRPMKHLLTIILCTSILLVNIDLYEIYFLIISEITEVDYKNSLTSPKNIVKYR